MIGMLFRLAIRNVIRQKVRSSVTLTAIVLGVAGLILAGGFVKDIFFQLGEAVIHSQTGHIQVFNDGFLERGTRYPERFILGDPAGIAESLRSISDVTEVSARLNFSGLLNNGRRDLAVIGEGIEADKEARLGTYLRLLSGRQLTTDDSFGIMLGQGVAATLGLLPGDTVTLLMNSAEGALNTLDFEVVGIFQSFSKDFDARAVRVPLKAVQELMMTEGANLLVVSLANTEATDGTVALVRSALPAGVRALTWHELSDFYGKAVQMYDRQFGVLQVIILFMVLLSVANTVNMNVFERQSEFGTLQALGNTHAVIFHLIVLENVVLGALGACAGVVFGLILSHLISSIGIPMPAPPNSNQGYTALIRPDTAICVVAFAIGFAATALASVLPALRVSRTPVVDALRQS